MVPRVKIWVPFLFFFFFCFMLRLAIRSSDCHIWDLFPVPRGQCSILFSFFIAEFYLWEWNSDEGRGKEVVCVFFDLFAVFLNKVLFPSLHTVCIHIGAFSSDTGRHDTLSKFSKIEGESFGKWSVYPCLEVEVRSKWTKSFKVIQRAHLYIVESTKIHIVKHSYCWMYQVTQNSRDGGVEEARSHLRL